MCNLEILSRFKIIRNICFSILISCHLDGANLGFNTEMRRDEIVTQTEVNPAFFAHDLKSLFVELIARKF